MAGRENYFWHKLHSLSGIIPTGFYLIQHLTLNTFSLAGARQFNSVIMFFEHMPVHVLYVLKFLVVWPPLIFHAVYGLFITSRAEPNYHKASLHFRENRYYTFQRWTGIIAFVFLCYHMASTSVLGQIQGADKIYYETWAQRLSEPFGTHLILVFYIVGVLSSTYHFAYGIWNFCIRWGITISESAQRRMAKFSQALFLLLSLLGLLALAGFFKPLLEKPARMETARLSAPIESRAVVNR